MKTIKVLVLCPGPKGKVPTQRLKYEQYLSRLEKHGFHFTISPFQTNRFWQIINKKGFFLEKVFWTFFGYCLRVKDLLRLPFYDIVFVNLWVTPLGSPLFERLVFFMGKKVIYDIDDMLFINPESGEKRWIDKIKGKNKSLTLMKHANYVIVCTPKLEEIALTLNKYKNVIDISSTFDTKRFSPVKEYGQNKITTLGWTGTHSTIPYLKLLQNVLQHVAEKRKIKLLVIANTPYRMEGVETEYRAWSEKTEVKDLHEMEIGLYPIPTNEWSLGKSSLKALTYMSIAIPAVATAYGTNFRVIENGVSGILVSTEEEWTDKLIELIDDVDLRRKIGLAGRRKVEELFSIEANFPKYLKVFETVTKM